MKEVEKEDDKEVEKPDIPDVSGGLSYPDGGCIPNPFEPHPWPQPGYPGEPGGPVEVNAAHGA